MEFLYSRKKHGGRWFDNIDQFWEMARKAFVSNMNEPVFMMLELQPGDGTRYRLCVTRPAAFDVHDPMNIGRADPVVVAMLVPSFCVVELDMRGPRPTAYDTPMCNLNPYTCAIFADVLAAVVWSSSERAYDYNDERPAPKEVVAWLKAHPDAAAPAVEEA